MHQKSRTTHTKFYLDVVNPLNSGIALLKDFKQKQRIINFTVTFLRASSVTRTDVELLQAWILLSQRKQSLI